MDDEKLPKIGFYAHEKLKRNRCGEVKPWEGLKRSSRKGFVYFVLAEGTGTIKVGKTMQPRTRFSCIQAGIPYKIHELLTLPCRDMHMAEWLILRCLSENKISGEWFRLTDDVINLIEYAGNKGAGPLLELITNEDGITVKKVKDIDFN